MLLIKFAMLVVNVPIHLLSGNILNHVIPMTLLTDCGDINIGDETFATYYNSYLLQCLPCSQSREFQLGSQDGLSCTCEQGYYLTQNFGGSITCQPCGNSEVTSWSGYECVTCLSSSCDCSADDNQMAGCVFLTCSTICSGVERNQAGYWQHSNKPSLTCETCVSGTLPDSSERRCIACNAILSVSEGYLNCKCVADQLVNEMCTKKSAYINSRSFTVDFGQQTFTSSYLQRYGASSLSLCRKPFQIQQECQRLANMCVLQMYKGSNLNEQGISMCKHYKDLLEEDFSTSGQLLPLLFYSSVNSLSILDFTNIPTIYGVGLAQDVMSHLDLLIDTYSAEGQWLGRYSALNGQLQLCQNTLSYLNAAYDFGVSYHQECQIPAKYFFDSGPTILYDMFIGLQYKVNGAPMLYSVAVLTPLNKNSGDQSTKVHFDDARNWLAVRRFFLIDVVSGQEEDLKAVRVATNFEIHVTLQRKSAGLIYPPYVRIGYTAYHSDSLDTPVKISFQVIYHEDHRSSYVTVFGLSCCILGTGVLVLSAVLTRRWQYRSGRLHWDLLLAIKFFVISSGHIANALFAISFVASCVWLNRYKNQSVAVQVEPNPVGVLFSIAVLVAFILKFISVASIVFRIITIDIFFIDWENPSLRPKSQYEFSAIPYAVEPSIWRSYFVIRKYADVMSRRRLHHFLRIILTLFLLEFVFCYGATAEDPWWRIGASEPDKHPEYHAPSCITLRFACIALCYILVAIGQQGCHIIYCRWASSPIFNLVDLCSVANISIFIFDHELYGHYIHGRSIHGNSDVSLLTCYINFRAEQLNLRRTRGLIPGEDMQTFSMSLPRKMRALYDRIMVPLLTPPSRGGLAASELARWYHRENRVFLTPQMERTITVYGIMNNFLQAFIDHRFADFDYIYHKRQRWERFLNFETKRPDKNGYFYGDPHFAFNKVLLYGNETTLIIFEVLLMAVVDIYFTNYLIAAGLNYLTVSILLGGFCRAMGLANIAKKSLLDRRLII